MKMSDATSPSMNLSTEKKAVFVFMTSSKFWEGLFDTMDIGFVKSLLEHQLANFSTIIMTSIVPRHISEMKLNQLLSKEGKLKQVFCHYNTEIEFLHIQGRTLSGAFNASKELRSRLLPYKEKFIWAKNYFNSFIGVLLKKRVPDTFLHFEMSGLVPEEQLHYSGLNLLVRIAEFVILQFLERVNLSTADSISVVSRRFKEYIVKKHHIDSQKIEVLPYFYNHQSFYPDKNLRSEYRKKYQIADNQTVILYSGMLQRWQKPDLLFTFLRNIKKQDINQVLRLLVLTFDQEKARQYCSKYGLKDVIITSASGEELNAVYNVADIGLAFRSADMVSFVSSPVKIPEYLATGNSLITLEYIGDYGLDLQGKKYALVKKNETYLLRTTIDEIRCLEKPDTHELNEIHKKYSIRSNLPVIKRILNKQND